MISLRNAAKELSVPYSNVYRWAKQQGFDTSHGLNDEEFQALKRSLSPETTQTAEIVYLEPTFQLNLPPLPQLSTQITPLITDDQVNAVRMYVDEYQRQVELELQQAQMEIEATRQRNDDLARQAYRLKLLREKRLRSQMEKEIEKEVEENRTGKSGSQLQGGV